MIICAVLAALTTLSTPDTLWKVDRFAVGAQIITERADRLRWLTAANCAQIAGGDIFPCIRRSVAADAAAM